MPPLVWPIREEHPLWADELEKGNFLVICAENHLEKGAARGAQIEEGALTGGRVEEDSLSSGRGIVTPQKGTLCSAQPAPPSSVILGHLQTDSPLRNTSALQPQVHWPRAELSRSKR